jgi:hypothetical protein
MCWGPRFVWVTDCYAVKFILSYDGINQAILQLQMLLMGWDVDIVHQCNEHLIDANYWYQLDAKLCYDPLFHTYLSLVEVFKWNHPTPTKIPMNVEHMPYYQGPRIPNLKHSLDGSNVIAPHTNFHDQASVDVVDHAGAMIMTQIVTSGDLGFTSLSDAPDTKPISRVLYNSKLPVIAYSISHFPWTVYGFNSGHFVSTIKHCNLPFLIILACNLYAHGCALFHKVAKCPTILPSTGALLDHIYASGNTSSINGYLIHSHRYQSSKPTTTFWLLQASVVEQLYAIRKLCLFIAFIHPDHDGCSATKFVTRLHPQGWIISKSVCSFPNYSDSVVGTCSVLIGIHDSTQSKVKPLLFCMPPTRRPLSLSSFIWLPFNVSDYQLSYARDDPSFDTTTETNGTVATLPSPTLSASLPSGLIVLYYLHWRDGNSSSLNGLAVLSLDSLCPQFNGSPNTNLFRGHFGVEFNCSNHHYVRAISPFKFASCYGFTDNLRYHLSQPDHWFALNAGIPALTSAWI